MLFDIHTLSSDVIDCLKHVKIDFYRLLLASCLRVDRHLTDKGLCGLRTLIHQQVVENHAALCDRNASPTRAYNKL